MRIEEAIDRADALKPNVFSTYEKVKWLSFLDATIFNDIISKHEFNDNEVPVDEFEEYSPDDLDSDLLVGFPYDELYVKYLQMRYDEANEETVRYNNSAALFNSFYSEFAAWYNRTHKPIKQNVYAF